MARLPRRIKFTATRARSASIRSTEPRALREPEGGETEGEEPIFIEAAAIRRSGRTARVRVLATGEALTIRASDLWHVMPGHVVTLSLTRRWQHRGQLFAEGRIEEVRIDAPALGLPPLRLEERGPLELGGEAARSAYEMELVLPWTRAGSGADPILAAIARKERRDLTGAGRMLMDLLTEDLRCLDAYAHLGNFLFLTHPEHSLIYYEIGAAIGEHALGPDFTGALPWAHLGNRPFLRCLRGQGLTLWQLDRHDEAVRVFQRLLWLNPTDEQGATRCLAEVKAGRPWSEDDDGGHR